MPTETLSASSSRGDAFLAWCVVDCPASPAGTAAATPRSKSAAAAGAAAALTHAQRGVRPPAGIAPAARAPPAAAAPASNVANLRQSMRNRYVDCFKTAVAELRASGADEDQIGAPEALAAAIEAEMFALHHRAPPRPALACQAPLPHC